MAEIKTNGAVLVGDEEPAAPLVVKNQNRVHLKKLRASTVAGVGLEDEIGTTGLRQFGGYVLEEWLIQLSGRRAAWAYREMMDNDPVVGAILFAIEMLARGVAWQVDGGDAERAEFVEECMHDMSQTWLDFISEALSMLPYGWSLHELVYKKRQGPQPAPPENVWTSPYPFPQPVPLGPARRQMPSGQVTPNAPNLGWSRPLGAVPSETEEDSPYVTASSEFKDGKVGWRKIPVRAQETLLRWHFDGYSGLRAMEQIDWHGGNHIIPMEKSLLFRTKTTRNNPEGRSILRNAWTSFYKLNNIQQIEAIGIERDLAGIPVVSPPEGIDIYSPALANVRSRVEELVQSLRRDEDEGIVLPGGWKIELMSTGGTRQISTDEVIRRYEQRIASSILADFVLIGQDAVGSFAMVDIKSELFGIAIDTILDIVCNTMNKYAIPRLLALNGMSLTDTPRITHSSAGRMDLEKVGRFLQSVALAGGQIPWSKELMMELFKELGLPIKYEGALETEGNPTGPVHRTTAEEPPAEPPKLEQREGMRAQGPRNDERVRTNPVQKAEGLTGRMGEQANLLSNQLEAEISGALRDLGEEAATSMLHEAIKADRPRFINRLAQRVIRRVDVKGWVEHRLMPILRNHAGRTALDAQRIVKQETGIEVNLPEETMQEVTREAGSQLRVNDLEPQVRASIVKAITDGLKAGDSHLQIADRIRQAVPAGRFIHAGVGYRSSLIARNETANLQRKATIGLYKSSPRITAVRLRDGVYGPPRSDQACIERDGEEVPIEHAERVLPYHPLCTLGFEPVIGE